MILKTRTLVAIAALPAFFLASCGDADEDSSSGDTGDTAESADSTVCESADDTTDDLLAQICEKGTLTVSTDPAYPPQSSLNEETGEYEGFDIDVATEIADRLGVDIAWQAPAWETITAGSWNGRWDMSVGSMTVTNERAEVLNFTQPYYYTPAVALVHESNSSVQDLTTDLDGKKVGVCQACAYESFLEKTLDIEGFEFDFVIDDAEVKAYDTDTTALQDLALGDGARLDAAMTSLTTAQGFVDSGQPVKIVGDPLFYEPLAVAIDKSSESDPESFTNAVDQIVQEMHNDGTLSQMSEEWFDGTDLTVQQ